jgi:hypothetical protein
VEAAASAVADRREGGERLQAVAQQSFNTGQRCCR